MEGWNEFRFRRRRTVVWRGRRHTLTTITVLWATKPITMVREMGKAWEVTLAEPPLEGDAVTLGMKFTDAKLLRVRHVRE